MGVVNIIETEIFFVNSGRVIAKFGLFLAEIVIFTKILLKLREAQNFFGLFQPNERKFANSETKTLLNFTNLREAQIFF